MDTPRPDNSGSRLARVLLLVLGSLFVALGVIGAFVPVLPTTPFLLLAAACYIRSSRRFYDWLVGSRWLGGYIRSYHEGRKMPLRDKLVTIALLWLSIGASAIFFVDALAIRVMLGVIAVGVTIHLARR